MSYKINDENMGSTVEHARRMVEELRARGYDVEFTTESGLVNGVSPQCPVDADEWAEVWEMTVGDE